MLFKVPWSWPTWHEKYLCIIFMLFLQLLHHHCKVCIIWNDLGVSNTIAKVSFASNFLQYHGDRGLIHLPSKIQCHDDVYHWQYLSWYFVFCNQILHILVLDWMLLCQTHANNLNQVLPQKGLHMPTCLYPIFSECTRRILSSCKTSNHFITAFALWNLIWILPSFWFILLQILFR